MFRLAHISDIHLGPMPKTCWTQLLSKRITGYINWQRNRAAEFSPAILNRLAAHMQMAAPDHIVVTGDLVNISLTQEFERAARWLDSLGSGKDISVICGNHDAYVNGALEEALDNWQEYLVGDDNAAVLNNNSFPVLRRRGPCSIILANSALPTKPFDATGMFDQKQAERLEKILHQEKEFCRVILIHHPPFENATTPTKRLFGDDLFRDVVRSAGANLVLHGHTHLDTLAKIDGPERQVPVVCVPAGGQSPGGRKPAAQYNWFEIEADAGNWKITQSKFGYRNEETNISFLAQNILL